MPGSRLASREPLRATALLPGPVGGHSESPAGSQGDTQTPRRQVCCVPTVTRTCSAFTVKGKGRQWAAAAQHHPAALPTATTRGSTWRHPRQLWHCPNHTGTARRTAATNRLFEKQQRGQLPGALPRKKQNLLLSGVMPLMQEITLFQPEAELGSKSLRSCAPDICLCALATAYRGCQAPAEAL